MTVKRARKGTGVGKSPVGGRKRPAEDAGGGRPGGRVPGPGSGRRAEAKTASKSAARRPKRTAPPAKQKSAPRAPKGARGGGHGFRLEPLEARRKRAAAIVAALRALYPDAACEMKHSSALELLVATILSAQCTDARVNMTTPALFARYRGAAAFAAADFEELCGLIRSTGFYRNKAKAIIALGKALVEKHGGEVPGTMEELVPLPGVGRKTANVLLSEWFGKPGIAVDTHVIRLTGPVWRLTGKPTP